MNMNISYKPLKLAACLLGALLMASWVNTAYADKTAGVIVVVNGPNVLNPDGSRTLSVYDSAGKKIGTDTTNIIPCSAPATGVCLTDQITISGGSFYVLLNLDTLLASGKSNTWGETVIGVGTAPNAMSALTEFPDLQPFAASNQSYPALFNGDLQHDILNSTAAAPLYTVAAVTLDMPASDAAVLQLQAKGAFAGVSKIHFRQMCIFKYEYNPVTQQMSRELVYVANDLDWFEK